MSPELQPTEKTALQTANAKQLPIAPGTAPGTFLPNGKPAGLRWVADFGKRGRESPEPPQAFGRNVPRAGIGLGFGGLASWGRWAGTSPVQGVAKSQSVPKAAAGASAGAARTTSMRTGSWPGASMAIQEGTWILSNLPGGPKR